MSYKKKLAHHGIALPLALLFYYVIQSASNRYASGPNANHTLFAAISGLMAGLCSLLYGLWSSFVDKHWSERGRTREKTH